MNELTPQCCTSVDVAYASHMFEQVQFPVYREVTHCVQVAATEQHRPS
jgi:hypothetical protein